MSKMHGVEVPESEVAEALGYKDVYEFRRACTEQGRRIEELEFALKQAKDEVCHMQWAGRRCQYVLERVQSWIQRNCTLALAEPCNDLLLAIDVVCGHPDGIDWYHRLIWLEEFEKELQKELPSSPWVSDKQGTT